MQKLLTSCSFAPEDAADLLASAVELLSLLEASAWDFCCASCWLSFPLMLLPLSDGFDAELAAAVEADSEGESGVVDWKLLSWSGKAAAEVAADAAAFSAGSCWIWFLLACSKLAAILLMRCRHWFIAGSRAWPIQSRGQRVSWITPSTSCRPQMPCFEGTI